MGSDPNYWIKSWEPYPPSTWYQSVTHYRGHYRVADAKASVGFPEARDLGAQKTQGFEKKTAFLCEMLNKKHKNGMKTWENI